MCDSFLCRLCLATDVRLITIANSPSQNMYEKLTNIALDSMGKPKAACYLCVYQLRKCQAFVEQVIQADELLTRMLQAGTNITSESIAMIDREAFKVSANLGITQIQFNNLDYCQPVLEIKQEIPSEMVEITVDREELQSENRGISRSEKIKLNSIGGQKTIIQEQDGIPERALQEKIEISVKEELDESQTSFMVEIKNNSLENLKNHYDVEKANENNIMKSEQSHFVNNYIDENNHEYSNDSLICNDHEQKFNESTLKDLIESRDAVKPKVYFDSDPRPYLVDTLDSSEQHVVIHDISSSFQIREGNSEPEISHSRPNQKENLTSRLKIQIKAKPYKCTECEYRCSVKGNLIKHSRTHTGEKPYACSVCDYKSSQKVHLKEHMKRHTGEKPYQCPECAYRFNRKDSLKVHLKTHTGEKPYKCSECEYRCRQKGTLVKHLRTHTGEKPYECSDCKYRCRQKDHLVKHIRTHTGEKPYKCTICEYRCKENGHLKTHLRTHTGEKPYECSVCEYRSSRKRALKQHLRTHSGEKPHKCTVCEYRCSRKHDLKRHSKTHIPKTYECTVCHNKFTDTQTLDMHIKTHATAIK